ncbi:MAG: hypothetical protein V8Q83_10500 [Blautia sp.]
MEPLLIRNSQVNEDIRITLNTYGHLYPNQQRKIANLLDNENENAVICDYNYVFDPNVYLKRFFREGTSGEYIFLINEVHNND